MQGVSWSVSEGIAVLGIGRNGACALSPAIRRDLAAALSRAVSDPEVRGIVLRASDQGLSRPLDAAEAMTPEAPPETPDLGGLCRMVETCAKPVVALIEGPVVGPGAELVLAAHARVAAPDARIAFAEIALGLPPAAGASQRLPRLLGAEAALDLLLGARSMPLTHAPLAPLVDATCAAETALSDACDHARALADAGSPRPTAERRAGFANGQGYQDAIAKARAARKEGAPLAYTEILSCVEAAQLLPFEAGLAFERASFETCFATDTSHALRHLQAAERSAQERAAACPGPVQPVARLGLAGAGVIGTGVALAALDAGLTVIVLEKDIDALRALSRRVGAVYARAVERGRLSEAHRQARLDRLKGVLEPQALEAADLILDTLRAPGTDLTELRRTLAGPFEDTRIFTTAVPGRMLDTVAAQTAKRRRTVGLFFQVPPHTNRLVEIGVGADPRDVAVATAAGLVRRLGKLPILTRPDHGYPSERLRAALLAAADCALAAGARPVDVDQALRGGGLARGVYDALDTAGLGSAARDGRDLGLRDGLVAEGHVGRGVGRGYYVYEAGATPVPNPEAERILSALRSRDGAPDADTIRLWCHAALVNEGIRMIEDGTVRAAGDVDLVAVHALGLPRARGGPMVAADLAGLFETRKMLLRLAERDAALWTPAPLLQELVKNGRRLADMVGV